jgi:hypothetical protein
MLIPFAGIAKDKGGGPDYVPITDYVVKAQTYNAMTGSVYQMFDFTEPFLLNSIEVILDNWGATTTECESQIQLHDLINPSYETMVVLVKKSWRSAEDNSILRLEFPTPVLIDPQTHALAFMIQPSGGFCGLTLNAIASAIAPAP